MVRNADRLTQDLRTTVSNELNTDLGGAKILERPCQCRYHFVLVWMTAGMLDEHLGSKL